jgi:isoleucyl-tRNA synthetase
LYDNIKNNNFIIVNVDDEEIKLIKDDFEIFESEKKNISSTNINDISLFIDTSLTPELEAEGFAREIVRRIQSMRKELDLDVEQKISTIIKIDENKQNSLKKWESYIKEETRSVEYIYSNKPVGKLIKNWDINNIKVEIGIKI